MNKEAKELNEIITRELDKPVISKQELGNRLDLTIAGSQQNLSLEDIVELVKKINRI